MKRNSSLITSLALGLALSLSACTSQGSCCPPRPTCSPCHTPSGPGTGPTPPNAGFVRVRLTNASPASQTITVQPQTAGGTNIGMSFTVTALTGRDGARYLASPRPGTQKVMVTHGSTVLTFGPLSTTGDIFVEIDVAIDANGVATKSAQLHGINDDDLGP